MDDGKDDIDDDDDDGDDAMMLTVIVVMPMLQFYSQGLAQACCNRPLSISRTRIDKQG